MSELYIVIPAAGMSRRYQEQGYSLKPLIKVRSKSGIVASMLHHVEETAPLGIQIVALPLNVKQPWDSNSSHVTIAVSTGQADTVYQVVRSLPGNARVLVLDCDMLLHRIDLQRMVHALDTFDMTVAVTRTFDPNASRVDRVPFPSLFAEKKPISEWGIIGARAFRNAWVLTNHLEKVLAECRITKTEPYISMVGNCYKPGHIFAWVVNDFVDLGTPERLLQAGWEFV